MKKTIIIKIIKKNNFQSCKMKYSTHILGDLFIRLKLINMEIL